MLAYFTPGQYDSLFKTEKNNHKNVIANISATTLETNVDILPVIQTNSEMIFPGDHTPIREVVLQDAKIVEDTQEKLNCLLHPFEDIMSSSSNDIGYTN